MFTQEQLDEMNKVQLRSAAREHNVKGYSKMNVAQLRAALPTGKGDEAASREEATAEKLSDAFLKAAGADNAVVTPPKQKRQAKQVAPAADGVKRPKAGGKCAEVWSQGITGCVKA